MHLLENYPYEDDELYWWWLAKQRIRQSIAEEVATTLQKPLVVGNAHDALTEEHPANTRPLPAIRQFRPKGR